MRRENFFYVLQTGSLKQLVLISFNLKRIQYNYERIDKTILLSTSKRIISEDMKTFQRQDGC